MYLTIDFPDGAVLRPKIMLKKDRHSLQLQYRRWVQLISLLTYRLMTNDNNGWVTYEEINCLTSFNKLSINQLFRYLTSSSKRNSNDREKLLCQCIELSRKDPVRLWIDPSCVAVDILRLAKYVDQIYLKPKSLLSIEGNLFELAMAALKRYDLIASFQMFKLFIENVSKDEKKYGLKIIYALLCMVDIERKLKRNEQFISEAHATALQLINRLSSEENKTLLKGYILNQQMMSMVVTRENIDQHIRLNEEIINIYDKTNNRIADKYYMLSSLIYFYYYLVNSYSTCEVHEDKFNKSLELHKQIDKYDFKIFNSGEASYHVKQLQRSILLKLKSGQIVDEKDMKLFESLKNDPSETGYNILVGGNWIRTNMMRLGADEMAVEFCSRLLEEFAFMHETNMYQRIMVDYRKLKNKIK